MKVNGLLLGIVEIILLLAVLTAATPAAMDYLTRLANGSAILNATGDVVGHSQSMMRLLLPSSLGGILWFVLCILIVVGVVFLIVKSGNGKGY